jgi:hypothetical protein
MANECNPVVSNAYSTYLSEFWLELVLGNKFAKFGWYADCIGKFRYFIDIEATMTMSIMANGYLCIQTY